MYSFSFQPLIKKPTRINENTATLIDNIYCNDEVISTKYCGILYTDISDHFSIFCVNHNSDILSTTSYIKIRQLTAYNIKVFCNKIRNIAWDPVLECNDCHAAYTIFHKAFVKCYNESFPFKLTESKYKTRNPWLTVGLKNSIKQKNKLFYKSRKMPTYENISLYKKFRHCLNILLRRAERNHYDVIMNENRTNMKKMLSIIRNVTQKK